MPDINESIAEFAEEVSATAGALVALIEEAREATANLERATVAHTAELHRAVARASAAACRAERAERRTDAAVEDLLTAGRVDRRSPNTPTVLLCAVGLALALAIACLLGVVKGVEIERGYQLRERAAEVVP